VPVVLIVVASLVVPVALIAMAVTVVGGDPVADVDSTGATMAAGRDGASDTPARAATPEPANPMTIAPAMNIPTIARRWSCVAAHQRRQPFDDGRSRLVEELGDGVDVLADAGRSAARSVAHGAAARATGSSSGASRDRADRTVP
jgi:hypothetical protein